MFLDLTPGVLTEPVTGRRWERDEIARQVGARVRHYQRQGLKAGDRVFIHFGNRLEFFAELLAVWWLGGCVIPLDSRLTAFEVENLASTATPQFAVVDDGTDATVTKCVAAAGVSVVHTLESVRADGEPSGTTPGGRVRLDDDALILFTSGSTGSPKGVVHTHRSLRARWITLRQSLGLADFRRTLCLLPTHFGHALICNCLFPWLSGQDLFIAPPFKPELLMRLGALIDEHTITFLSSVPPMWRMALKLARRPAQETLARVHCGSAPLSAHLWKDIQTWTGTKRVHNAYGITETGSWVAGTTVPDFTPEDGLIGVPWGAVVKILSTRDTDVPLSPAMECAVGEPGFVWLNTPALMKGYFNRDDLTDQVVSHGWFMTGDIGVIDERGLLYLRGRERDEINKGGAKIYPADVDAVVERFDRTTDVCTFALDDPVYGQNVGMAVALSDASDATVRALYQVDEAAPGGGQAAGALVPGGGDPAHLTRQAQPRPGERDVHAARTARPGENPQPAGGRVRLMAQLATRAQRAEDLIRFLRTIQKPDHPIDKLDERTSLIESGLIDSLAVLEIVTYLEETYGIDFIEKGIDPGELISIGGILGLIESEHA